MHSKQTPDSEIAERLVARDPDAIAAAYDRYGKIAYSIFLRVTRDHPAAEDLVQELFMRLWNRARDFDAAKGSLGIWVLSIARNMAIDHVRSAQARFQTRLRSLEQTDPLLFSYKSQEPEFVLDNVKSVQGALSELNDNQRRVLEMAYFEGFSQSEIASKLNQPLGTVKSWMRSALARLRTTIKAGVTE
jgi:RNA polymerase sigma-70 factor (ECF subfamily)